MLNELVSYLVLALAKALPGLDWAGKNTDTVSVTFTRTVGTTTECGGHWFVSENNETVVLSMPYSVARQLQAEVSLLIDGLLVQIGDNH
jgi:hypothetical protein